VAGDVVLSPVESVPEWNLPLPHRLCNDCPQRPLGDWVASARDRGHRKDRFLDGGRQQRQTDNLRDPRPRESERPRRMCEIVEFLGTNAAVDRVGEG
jgi:hypothetical protein